MRHCVMCHLFESYELELLSGILASASESGMDILCFWLYLHLCICLCLCILLTLKLLHEILDTSYNFQVQDVLKGRQISSKDASVVREYEYKM